MNNLNMITLGLTDRYIQEASLYPHLYLGRVTAIHKGLCRVATEDGELFADVLGKLRHQAAGPEDFPTVGDFVLLDRSTAHEGNGVIHHILTRKSLFLRKAAGTSGEAQLIAANVDTVFLCMSLNQDFSVRRLERYLSIAWDSGATPVVVLTKQDLCDDLPHKLAQVNEVALAVDILCTSSLWEDGAAALMPYLVQGKTAAFIGSSGVGKSTLINRLLGADALATREIRGDGKGRHTTTHRELMVLPYGGCVIDTPGMRELGLESGNLDKSFADISQLAQQCRFGDCSHTREPGCAVQQAIEEGLLSEERLQSYQKLQKELGYEGLNSRQIEEKKIGTMLENTGMNMKNMRKHMKEKNKGR